MKPFSGAPRAGGAHLLSLTDLDAGSLEAVLERSAELKSAGGFAGLGRQPLAGKSVALIFDKPSLRTRVSFEVGIAKLGGITTTLTGGEVGLGTREPVEDIGRTLSIGERTVQAHLGNVLAKLSLSSRTQAALWAVREGLVRP